MSEKKFGVQSMHNHPKYRGWNPVTRLSHCYCHKLTAASYWPGWFERLLMKFIPHFDIVKTIDVECDTCGGTGTQSGLDCREFPHADQCWYCDHGQKKETVLYLRRFYLWRSKWIGKNWGDLYLHHIVKSDDDKDPHDHPWGFKGIILKGRYLDEQWWWGPTFGRTFLGFEGVVAGSFINRPAEHIHRVIVPDGETAWTLIKTQGYGRDWNFVTENGPVFWRKYLNIDGEYGE